MYSNKQVIFDAERMRYPNTGLYFYCLHLGNELLKIANEYNKNTFFKIYADKDNHVFDYNPLYLNFNSFHKFALPNLPTGTIWHCNFQLTNYIPSRNSVKKVVTVHDLNFLREKKGDKQTKYLKKLQRNIDCADVLVCISEFVKKEVIQHCNVQGKRVEVIYNGNNINDTVVAKPLERDGLDLSKPFLFAIGVVLPKKNFLVLVHLLVHNNLNLVISGVLTDDNYKQEIIALATKLGVQDRVFLTGPVSESEKYYLLQNCHVFCFPSLTEGFGLPVVEAMHFGCDILLSTHTSLPEVGGDVVRYFDSFDPSYLEDLSRDIASWDISGEEKNQVKERSKLFSWETAAKAYWQIYNSL
ncbi:glycosyltransferase family 4 protein [Sphingobacterium rhinopitheci]|uniref:glycosyltransferase family 4 protein n=1 Tax=Sphingobacterium rhinopitheci TaxID=2781960 RepID=UPI001F5159CF|nr:glycosyltransferase family 1 protein [Sphingobacterium rhinopitheci]MCI0920712.1 glycosyltransferase family 4 protein [Sphingobacterium rhinopitheci]